MKKDSTTPKEQVSTNGAPLGTVSVVDGGANLRFSSDVVIDIETMPLRSDSDDGSLLDPQTARIMTIGYFEPAKDRYVVTYDQDEKAVCNQFWDIFLRANGNGAKIVGFNIAGFDVPFIVKRSWFHSVPVPKTVWGWGNRLCDTFVDLMVMWKCSGFKDFISLDALSRFLQVGGKNGNGAKFWKVWQTDQAAALEYLLNDVLITGKCAEKMGVVPKIA